MLIIIGILKICLFDIEDIIHFLSDARIRRLESIGMAWDIDEKVWNDTYQKCAQHFEKYRTISNIKKYAANLAHYQVIIVICEIN